MAILHMKNCPFCGAYPDLIQRNGGWTVDCPKSNELSVIINNWEICAGQKYWEDYNREDYQKLYDTPNEAVEAWNKILESTLQRLI